MKVSMWHSPPVSDPEVGVHTIKYTTHTNTIADSQVDMCGDTGIICFREINQK